MRNEPGVITATPQPGHARNDRAAFGITAACGLAARHLAVTVEVLCTRN